ncbi:hypothetical protein DER46DRAFT_572869 [Fusarium sp. MPI-SDFR-AT-0072]|nr:hypothetical protein DER46DRAFT_572869 [Fusarium sp. MPI-SDFR-AT-0072]
MREYPGGLGSVGLEPTWTIVDCCMYLGNMGKTEDLRFESFTVRSSLTEQRSAEYPMIRTEVSKAPGIRGQALILAREGGRNLSIMPEFVCRTNVGKHQIRLTSNGSTVRNQGSFPVIRREAFLASNSRILMLEVAGVCGPLWWKPMYKSGGSKTTCFETAVARSEPGRIRRFGKGPGIVNQKSEDKTRQDKTRQDKTRQGVNKPFKVNKRSSWKSHVSFGM